MSRPQDPAGAARAAAGVVYVVAKAPAPGQSKTRLCPPLTPAAAARLARAFLLDAWTPSAPPA